jgi:3-hydroxyisobutyrate dehydrogenase-like beta-hydroxyacid dehydrogenase
VFFVVLPQHPVLAFIGLGAMGGPMARRLLEAGYSLMAVDLDPAKVACLTAHGASAASAEDAVAQADVIFTSLPSSDAFVRVADTVLVPLARPGQVFIDLGTVTPPETRRLSAAFSQRGAVLLDVPVSGGPAGSAAGTLRMFAGGDRETFDACLPLLQVLGDPERIVYCGPSGSGQVAKGVNQLAMGLGAAAYLEALAFGIRAGVAPEALAQSVGGGKEPWRQHFEQIARMVMQGRGTEVYVKYPELPYFLREAQEQGFSLPLTEALYAFCSAGPALFRDNMGRVKPSFWHELMHRDS